MSIDEVWLSHGVQANEEIASFAALWPVVHPDGTIEVTLAVGAEVEHEYLLHPGDTFSVRDQTWKLDHIENQGKPNWEIQLVRVK